MLKPSSTGHQGYLKEYPWHTIYNEFDGWCDELGYRLDCKIQNLIPTAEYEWESGSSDHSIEQSISIYMPSKDFINQFGLSHDISNTGCWVNDDNEIVFYDPSINSSGPSAALIRKDGLLNWLDDNDLVLVWLVGGEKQLFTRWASKFFGRLVYSGIYKLEKEGVVGDMWFLREDPKKENVA